MEFFFLSLIFIFLKISNFKKLKGGIFFLTLIAVERRIGLCLLIKIFNYRKYNFFKKKKIINF